MCCIYTDLIPITPPSMLRVELTDIFVPGYSVTIKWVTCKTDSNGTPKAWKLNQYQIKNIEKCDETLSLGLNRSTSKNNNIKKILQDLSKTQKFYFNYFYLCVCVYSFLSLSAPDARRCQRRSEKGIRTSGIGFTGGCQPFDASPGNQAQVFYETASTPNNLSSPDSEVLSTIFKMSRILSKIIKL